MMSVCVWVVAAVLCFPSPTQCQLGDRGVSSAPDNTAIGADPDEHQRGSAGGEEQENSLSEYEEEGEEEEDLKPMDAPWEWRPLEDTYRGCFEKEDFDSALMYVNLTQVREIHALTSKEEACFHMCRNKAAFSLFIALSPAMGGSADACGCFDELDPSDQVDSEACDAEVKNYRVYCGPFNFQCLSSGVTAVPSLLLLLAIPLVLILHSSSITPS